ncbi:iron exporter MbfA [Hoeflea sp. TYP-13]|uniref:iron exporter MbfA n=1 Tax=Hoeflea sp. TYP-13 TaxID=3230023 RepID=UPI0034C6613B
MLRRLTGVGRRSFSSLSEQEILALAISSEEDDGRIYLAYADALRDNYPASAEIFEAMAKEENEHRRRLIELYRKRFGERIILIRREHVSGYLERKPLWLTKSMSIDNIRDEAERMERQAWRFYLQAAKQSQDAATRKLLGDLAEEERDHGSMAHRLAEDHTPADVRADEAHIERRQMILTYIQPGLAGLMDGSVSTLAPIFAAAFATGDTWQTFLVGLAASIGAGISMGFTEVASDDGVISGRGAPIKRGLATGIMTTVGGLGHALPYLIPDFTIATTIAIALVFVELWVISWIQHKFMETSWSRAIFQVVLGGALVFAAGLLIGTA